MDKLLSLLKSNNTLSQLSNQLQLNEQLLAQIKTLLPKELSLHVSVAVIQDNHLVLWTTSPVWSSKLRFIAPSLRKAFPHVENIRIAVLPQEQAVSITSELPPVRNLASKNALLLLELAERISNKNLKATLMRLATHSTIIPTNNTVIAQEAEAKQGEAYTKGVDTS